MLRVQVAIQIAGFATSMLTLAGTCRPAPTCAAKCLLESKQSALTAGVKLASSLSAVYTLRCTSA